MHLSWKAAGNDEVFDSNHFLPPGGRNHIKALLNISAEMMDRLVKWNRPRKSLALKVVPASSNNRRALKGMQ